MIELSGDRLVFSFPEVHPEANCTVGFQRTLRIPDDGQDYPLPAGFGWFPLCHVDDVLARGRQAAVPASWVEQGGVLLAMHQAEAMWISFSGDYPVALKVAAGGVNAVSGDPWTLSPPRSPEDAEQDHVVIPLQPWLDGFSVSPGLIRQFVAMPLGLGATAEEQVTGKAEVGGLQLLAYPLRARRWEEIKRDRERFWVGMPQDFAGGPPPMLAAPLDLGLGLGGKIHQDISVDPYQPTDWDLDHPARCFVHLVNAEQWQDLTGDPMPAPPISRHEYAAAGIPWFDYDSAGPRTPGSSVLAGLESVAAHERAAGRQFDDGTIPIDRVIRIVPPVLGSSPGGP